MLVAPHRPRSPDPRRDAPAGDFEAIVLKHHAEIHRYLCRLTARTSEADDLAQETFLRAYRAWHRPPPATHCRAWLYAIATNAFRNRSRSEQRRRNAHATVRVTRHETHLDGPEDETSGAQLCALTDAAIRSLPIKQRLAFTMRKLEDLDYDCIGASLDCSAETARAHVFQALKKIRAALGDHVGPARRSS